ncbi:DoxX family protein [Beutenbergia cavernae DSM 12333]|uniref:DoxX family protein n=1 Tax=Beutenbergia cavernae (strain ATCC BAA-8 / DSM 12333 / CCUG 43141 / JCM 11478 / NBRC 16432 / NCIMB 13614 / HKI 0122) TaxID=471853 RepID=C5C3U3_BEUC1|nr:DoxX family membrane protein [Beutenbergia cavernae]ACQ82002.1 DoxX family protein [Beutenbergia cavernae DSM 12333]
MATQLQSPRPVPGHVSTPVRRAIDSLTQVLARYSVDALRVSLGLVFLAFGVLKFFPGASPAEELAVATIDRLTLGIVSGEAALLLTAVTEVVIGVTLVTGKFLKVGLVVLAGALVGIMSPLVLFTAELFPGGLPTLEAQYVFKDIVLAAAGLVVAAKVLGARFVAPSVSGAPASGPR